jgi:diguanylate cyclase (GGDEF)-like protein
LERLAELTARPRVETKTMGEALPLIALAVRARSAYLLYAEDTFRQIDERGQASKLELRTSSYWRINRQLVNHSGPCAFNTEDGKVFDLTAARPRLRRTHMAVLLPTYEAASDMLVACGIDAPLTRSGIAFMRAVAPVMAQLASRLIDVAQTKRKRDQVNALADIARVLTNTDDKQETLTKLATAIAGASGFDSVTISAFDESRRKFVCRAINRYRFYDHPVSEAYRQGYFDQALIASARTGGPMILADLTQENEAISPEVRRVLVGDSLFTCLATFPLEFGGELLGVMSLGAFRPHPFDDEEVAFLRSFADQAAMIIKGCEMYEQLNASRDELQRYAEKLQESMSIEHRLARTDPLTGLPNRRYLDEALMSEFAARKGQPISVIMADVDRFKEYNDRYGHLLGDDVLKMVASVAWRIRREGDLAGRYGGDEFLFILPEREQESAAQFAEEFREAVAVSRLTSPSGETLQTTVSVGVAHSPDASRCEPQKVIAQADSRMYEAKRQGGNRVSCSGLGLRSASR